MKWMSEWVKRAAAGVVIVLSVAISPACTDEDPGDSGEPGDPAASGPVVSRAVQEPPGAHCPEGGTAVQSGIDRDGDGVLGDHEVDTTLYVCRRDRVRLVDEPAGSHCPKGGTAIWVGDDRDGDDVLEPDEIRSVSYLCAAVHALLTRLVYAPPGAPCAGGAAIQVGHDIDDDGALADAEVLITEYVCGDAIAGQMVIKDAADVAFFHGVRAVAGDLWISHALADEIELPNLYFVGGRVIVYSSTSLTALRLPALYHVGGAFTLQDNPVLAELSVPQLHHVGGDLEVVGNDRLRAIDLVGVDVRGQLSISDNAALATIDWVAGTLGGIGLYQNAALTAVTLAAVSMIGGAINVVNNPQLATLTISSPNVTGGVYIAAHDRLATVQLWVSKIGGDLNIYYNPALTSLTAGRNETFLVNGDLIIQRSPISTLQLSGVSSGAYIRGDALLTDLQITQLQMYGPGLAQVYGRLEIKNNPLLAYIETHGAHDTYLASNPALEHAQFYYDENLWPESVHAGSLRVVSNPRLQGFWTWGAQSIGEVEIGNNPLLTWPGLNLYSAYSISIHDNTSMPVCRIQALFDAVEAYSELQSGNDEDGVCD